MTEILFKISLRYKGNLHLSTLHNITVGTSQSLDLDTHRDAKIISNVHTRVDSMANCK